MTGIIGKKIGMTRLIEDDGKIIPVTVVECQPNEIAQVKTKEKDGYSAIVLGYSKLQKPSKTKKFQRTREVKITQEDEATLKKGDQITLDILKEITDVEVISVSKGKGFQGTVKRHNFTRGPMSHGSHFHREPGSIGARAKPGRVCKGKRMAGRMGSDNMTIKTKVVKTDTSKNLLCLKGPVPGSNGSLITIRSY